MKSSRFSLLLLIPALLVALSGCLPASFYPYYTEKELVENDSLLGLWETDDGGEFYLFKKGDEKEYTLEVIADLKITQYSVHLFKLGSRHYLDIYPGADVVGSGFGIIPGHVIWACQVEKDRMAWTHFNYDRIKKGLDSGQMTGIKYMESNQVFFLPSSTQELQAFILKHEKEPDFFDSKPFATLHRATTKDIKPKEERK